MSTKRQELYDRLYYKFPRWYQSLFANYALIATTIRQHCDKNFHEAFRHVIRPYWKQYGVRVKKYWYKYLYELSGELNPRYLPHILFSRDIVPHFDNPMFIRQLADKNLHSLLFPTVKRPSTIFKYMDGAFRDDDLSRISEQEAFARLQSVDSFIVKPTRDTGQGKNVLLVKASKDIESLKEILAPYQAHDFIVQKIVSQHPSIAKFNPTSLNTIRIVTLVFHNEVHVLSSILRIGSKNSTVDNVSAGGYQCTILPDGTLDKLAYHPPKGNESPFVEKNDDGLYFGGFAVPSFDRILETTKTLAAKMPHLQLIGWDVAVDEDGDVVLIEFNSEIGQNQATCGPTFGALTEDVLAEVYGKTHKK